MKLTKEAQERARSFIYEQARSLEQRLFDYYFEGGSAEDVLRELATFQNEDGGFGRALEPDLRLPASSVIATTVALQCLRQLQIPADHPLVRGAMAYLLDTYDEAHEAWPIVPPTVDEAPHAPWWQYNPDLSQYLGNPRPEILGYCYSYAELVPDELRARLTQSVAAHLDAAADEMEMHDLLCYLRLVETQALPEAARIRMLPKLTRVVDKVVARQPSAWAAYGLKPLSVASAPDSPFAPMLAQAIEQNLDYEIEQQQADGAWAPPWSWGEAFPHAWSEAEREWKGILTVKTLRQLRDYGRLAL